MRLGIIDLGTNSVRFDIQELRPGKQVRPLHREKIMIRLGQGVFVNGQLSRDATVRTVHAFHTFKRICDELAVDRLIAIATSALREAGDSSRLVREIKSSTGIEVRIISGEEEARLIAIGILTNEPVKGRAALIDIGGGSTEISIVNGRGVTQCESFPLGTARLQQMFLKRSPPSPRNIEQLRAYIRETLNTKITPAWYSPEVIGSSGTIRTLARMGRRKNGDSKKKLKLEHLRRMNRRMSRMNTAQLLNIPGMEARRSDMILAGSILLEECMIALDAKRLRATEFSLRHGILREQVDLSRKLITSRIALHIPDLIAKAQKLGGNRVHLEASAECARTLFRRLRHVHKLDGSWELYLEAAAILRKTGDAISPIASGEHAYYIVKNSGFRFVDQTELEFIAQLVLRTDRQKDPLKDLPFRGKKPRRQAFLKLLALLRIIDGLDADTGKAAHLRSARVAKKEIRLDFAGGTKTELERFRVEQRRELFEQVYRRKLTARRI